MPRDLAPVVYQDGTQQVTARTGRPYTPPTGSLQHPDNFLSSANSSMTSGSVYFSPFTIGPVAKAYDLLGVNVSTAQVGGSTTFMLALYPDDGSGGRPNTAGGPLVSGPVSLAATGTASLALTGLRQPGWYWLSSLYNSATTPTTAAQVACIANASPSLWIPPTLSIGAISRALVLTGQTVLPTTATSPVGTGSGTIPVVAARAA